MNELGVNIAIFDDAGRVLLIQRDDFEVWCMAGGAVDAGEDPATAAIREAREETGLEVALTGMVGVYTSHNYEGDTTHIIVFRARALRVVGVPDPHEVRQTAYFAPDALPEAMLIWQHERIADAAAGYVGRVVRELREHRFPPQPNRAALYAMRDASGLTPSAFYLSHFVKVAREVLFAGTCV